MVSGSITISWSPSGTGFVELIKFMTLCLASSLVIIAYPLICPHKTEFAPGCHIGGPCRPPVVRLSPALFQCLSLCRRISAALHPSFPHCRDDFGLHSHRKEPA